MALTARLKNTVKKELKSLRRRYMDRFHAFTPEQFQAALAGLGVATGDAVLVHSSFDAFEGFQGKANDVITALQARVGPDGLLLMPTMGFTGSAIEWARSGTLFDVKRTPSRMGLVSELFRRTPGVVRSVHPTHPIACWGRDAGLAAQDHHLSRTPCGRGTPFEFLSHQRGKILLLGTGLGVLTYYHHLEEIFEPRWPQSPFTQEVFEFKSRTADGQVLETRNRLYEPAMSRRRNLQKLEPAIRRQPGGWREARIGRLQLILLDVPAVDAAVGELTDQGIYCYD
ncbi:AAC(3) family N-acetyltransferase [Pelomonas sp. SE-A7]|uniref:AAC(3) family N-acetyltransferase n=1 Tax=Pelomonas sp. SE-A7 TaxID=3054953 RepID=UPI00259C6EC5|nr:AAC(3) family N-acetyltransferase [Pelomonas sp. SE-A7]MDM4764888.1 AAC(3) family N-acetyltransferase [Pelomonas sp. SE-A7]